MTNLNNLILVQEFFLLLSSEAIDSDPLFISTSIDLTEFGFTRDELPRLNRMAQKLELALLTELNKHFEAASVVVEFREQN